MKRIVFISVLLMLLPFTGCKVQEDPAKILAEKEEMEFLFQNAVQAMKDKDFVLEANSIVFKYGHTAYVNSNTNFVRLSGDKATIQLAFNSPYAGPNGIGGITVDGNASNIKMEEDKKGNISFSMNVIGAGISATVHLTMPNGTNQCTATVNPNFNSNRIVFMGNLYSKEFSNVFKGRAL